jgi:hypothetical protein
MELISFRDFETRYCNRCTQSSRSICDSCLYEHMRSTWHIRPHICCPECYTALSHAAIKLILVNHNDSTLYESYTKFELDRHLEQSSEFVWCAHGCGSDLLKESVAMNNTVKCINCHKVTCFLHKCPWHDGMTCKEFDLCRANEQLHASQRWIDAHTKKCPKCHSHIEKNEGCDHMTCLKCKHEFCWLCLASYSGIRRHGAYLHRRTCKYYPATETRTIVKRLLDFFVVFLY